MAERMARWPPKVAFHHEFEWAGRELEVFLDAGRSSASSRGRGRPLDASQLNNFGSHGWSLPETPRPSPRLLKEAKELTLPAVPDRYLVALRSRMRAQQSHAG
ncbi:unnamed protein product [Effrenium voratum]|uniref:Uncharacterized protein n=1 Tax=Effrenium voratum TaxID=2562239 RepID=A0AA36N5B0_9DINO|nr:unnamed protein product [Effrenium voratum]